MIKVYFYAKKTPRKRDGKYPVMGRIVLDGKRVQFSTQIYLEPHLAHRVDLRFICNPETHHLLWIHNIITLIEYNMFRRGEEILLDKIIEKFKLIQSNQETFESLFNEHDKLRI